MYQFDVVTLFPEMFEAVTESGVTGRARERKLFELVLWNPRSFAANSYRTVDDRPYGGGPGMVMMVEPLEKAIMAARQRQKSAGIKQSRTVYLSPQGRRLDHRLVMEYAALQGLVWRWRENWRKRRGWQLLARAGYCPGPWPEARATAR